MTDFEWAVLGVVLLAVTGAAFAITGVYYVLKAVFYIGDLSRESNLQDAWGSAVGCAMLAALAFAGIPLVANRMGW